MFDIIGNKHIKEKVVYRVRGEITMIMVTNGLD
jgi:hypothetical protein